MEISISDGTGKKFIMRDTFYQECIGRPLVTEKREIFSFPFGDAELVRIAFPGVYIVYGDMQLYESRLLHFEMMDHELVEMHFALSGRGMMMDDVHGSKFLIRENEHNMHYMPNFKGHGDYSHHERYKFFEVHFSTDFFLQLAQCGSPGLRRFAEVITSSGRDKVSQLSRENLPISFPMHQCIRDVMNCEVEGALKLLFLQSKCIELLTLQAQMYEDSNGRLTEKINSSCLDKERIYYAREYLLEHALHPPSLTELAKVAGINEFKLKQGFRQVYNNTVFGYLSDYKLNQAREQLLHGDTAIKELADNLGYSSVQHFSHAFRKKFGVPPGKVRK